MKKFLVVIDTQYDFMMPNGALYVQGAEQIIVPGIEFLANLSPDNYAGVLFTYDTHSHNVYEGSSESEMFPIHCVEGTPGWENVFNPDLIKQPSAGQKGINVYTLTKGVFNMWEEDDIRIVARPGNTFFNSYESANQSREVFFEQMKDAGIDTIEIFGVASDFCVKWAVDGFVKRGFKVEVVDELCRGIGAPANDVFEGPDYVNVVLV